VDFEPSAIGDAENVADHVRCLAYRVKSQISTFSAVSIAASTSVPRYRPVLSVF
jgi:hypothetical protein